MTCMRSNGQKEIDIISFERRDLSDKVRDTTPILFLSVAL